jgi:uncharacterized protein
MLFKQLILGSLSVIAVVASLSSCGYDDRVGSSTASATVSLESLDSFYAACARGDTDQVQSQLRAQPTLANAATPETKDSPLMRAAEFSRAEIVAILLSHGANPNAVDANGRTALITASYVGDVTTVSRLLAANADPNAADLPYGFTPLLNATLKKHTEVVRLLLAGGADVELRAKDGRSALEIAEQHGSTEIAALIRAAKDAK